MLCTYMGSDQRYYPDYRDTFTGRSLEASPGGVYDIEVASGQPGLPLPPGDGRWTVAVVHEGVFEAPAPPLETPPWAPVPVPAAEPPPEPAAPLTPEPEAGASPADEES